MKRFFLVSGVLALVAGSASAEFVGIDIREDVDMMGAPAGVRTFHFYAMFDGNTRIDTVLSVGQPNGVRGFGLRAGAGDFFQEETPVIGGENITAPAAALIGVNPAFAFDTYVSIGLKVDKDGEDSTVVDPDFGVEDKDGSGGGDFITGGWYNSNPLIIQGAADSNGDVFLAQISVLGAEGLSLGHGVGGLWFGDIFEGDLDIFRQGDLAAGDLNFSVTLPVSFRSSVLFPSPGAVALFGLGGVFVARRRR